LLVAANSSSALQWTGTAHRGTERDGIVFYSFGGRDYTLDDPGSTRTGERTLYLDPSRPADAVLPSLGDRVLDIGTVGVPYLVAIGFLLAGWRRRRHRAMARGASDHNDRSHGRSGWW